VSIPHRTASKAVDKANSLEGARQDPIQIRITRRQDQDHVLILPRAGMLATLLSRALNLAPTLRWRVRIWGLHSEALVSLGYNVLSY
jgi:hypothetical protein